MENLIAIKLKELRERKSLSLQELADQVGVAKQSIHKFENGIVTPSSETLLKISDALNVSYSFFYEKPLDCQFTLQNIKFREKQKISNEKFEIEIKEEVCRYLSKFMELSAIMEDEVKFENPLKGIEISTDKDIEKAAKQLRKKWKLGNAPIADLVETLEGRGIFVVEIRRIEDFSGLSGMVNEEIPIIVLNESFKAVERKRFTALHELGHLVLDFSENLSDKNIEIYCDMFAGAVLLVDEVLFEELGKNRTVITLAELKRIKELFGISIQAIIMRARNSGFIDYKTCENWWNSYNEWYSNLSNSEEFGNYKGIEKAQRFNKLLYRGVAERRLSISKAAELSGRKVDVMSKEFGEHNFNIC
jgi:Zn-dependent peptidase ImmA (M78 family)